MARKKEPPLDGLSAKDLKRIREHLRKVWSWTHPWRLVYKRAHWHPDGFPRCENKKCPQKGKPVPKIFVDHIKRVGSLDTKDNPILRMFIPSKKLQALCKKCHDVKTKLEKGVKLKFTDTF